MGKLWKLGFKVVNLRIAHLRIDHMVGNPEVGNPEPYQSSGLPTSIITLFSVYLLDLGWTIDSGCFEMISTYLIQSASMFN